MAMSPDGSFSSRSSPGSLSLSATGGGGGGDQASTSAHNHRTSRRKRFFNSRALGISFRDWIKRWKPKSVQDRDLPNLDFEDCHRELPNLDCGEEGCDPKELGLRRFAFDELYRATESFTSEIRRGVFGDLYNGLLTIGDRERQVCVRVMTRPTHWESWWATEIKVMSQLNHKNLAELLGWCDDGGRLALVYELLPGETLSRRLPKLPWGVRYRRIALGLASAMLYLQEGSGRCVLHMDIHPLNIMLDSDLNPKLKNFGFSRFADVQDLSPRDRAGGALGYRAPEFFAASSARRELDIYSFGMVALQIASGKRPFGCGERMDGLQEWVAELHRDGKILEAADPSLWKIFNAKEMERLLLVGLWCTRKDPGLRPSMTQVVEALSLQAPSSEPVLVLLPSPIETMKDGFEFDIGLLPEYQCRSSERKDRHSPIVTGFVTSLQMMLLQSSPRFEEILGTIRDYTAILVKTVGPPLDDWNELAQTVLRALSEDKFLGRFECGGKDEVGEYIASIEEDQGKLERLLAELREARAACKSIEEDVKLITARRARNVVMLEQRRRQSAISNLFQSVLGKHPSLTSAM